MKAVVLMVIFLSSFCLRVMADDDNPYAPIVARNVFQLVPMPTNPPEVQKPADPPAKITPNGIMDLFGQLQVLFKVATPPKPGQPPQDQSYVMSEGDRQDGIEVTKIDKQAGMITFDNHGVIQKLALTPAGDISSPGGPPDDGGHGFMPPGGRRFGGRLGMGRNLGTPGGGGGGGSMPTPSPMSSPMANQLSPEAQAILIEQNRINTQDQVDRGVMPPLPPTAITPEKTTGVGGAPLISTPTVP